MLDFSYRMPIRLGELGLGEVDIPRLVELVSLGDPDHMEGNFVKLTLADCEEIYKLAL